MRSQQCRTLAAMAACKMPRSMECGSSVVQTARENKIELANESKVRRAENIAIVTMSTNRVECAPIKVKNVTKEHRTLSIDVH